MFAIAARNGILLIKHCQYLERYEGETFGPGLVLRGTRERPVPIVMTALATVLVLLPLVIAGMFLVLRSVPNGRRHPGRPGHVHGSQPVHRSHALLTLPA